MQFFKHKFKRPLQIVQLVAIIIVTALVCVRLNERSTAFDVLAILMVGQHLPNESSHQVC